MSTEGVESIAKRKSHLHLFYCMNSHFPFECQKAPVSAHKFKKT